jgi:SEC-C motif-containing protein
MTCSCGNPGTRETCCGPIIAGTKSAPTPEALMRARYSAYVNGDIDFLRDSLARSERGDFDRDSAAQWSRMAKWEGLEIVRTEDGGPNDATGVVEFIARYRAQDETVEHREIATFRREDGRWFFVDGQAPKEKPFVREQPKIGPNEPCPCGSGKKFKKCCGKR